jgi:hypothetical protein
MTGRRKNTVRIIGIIILVTTEVILVVTFIRSAMAEPSRLILGIGLNGVAIYWLFLLVQKLVEDIQEEP